MDKYSQLGRLKSTARSIGPDIESPNLDFSPSVDMLKFQTSDLEIFAQEVLASLISNNFPPTPNNFAIFFDRKLEEKSESLRRQIKDIVELEKCDEDSNHLESEKTLKKGFAAVTTILQHSSTVYKNMTLMSKIVKQHKETLASTEHVGKSADIIKSFSDDISRFGNILQQQISSIKVSYEEGADVVKQVESATIFDGNLGLYNKKYFTSKLEQELNLVKGYNHKSSILFVELSDLVSGKIESERTLELMTRTISKLLLKTSRRSDVISHYGKGVFAVLLKHTNLTSAKLAAARIHDLVVNSNFFVGGQEVELGIAIGLVELAPDVSTESSIVAAIDAMKKAHDNPKLQYVIGSF